MAMKLLTLEQPKNAYRKECFLLDIKKESNRNVNYYYNKISNIINIKCYNYYKIYMLEIKIKILAI